MVDMPSASKCHEHLKCGCNPANVAKANANATIRVQLYVGVWLFVIATKSKYTVYDYINVGVGDHI